jgi:hypothetical protein
MLLIESMSGVWIGILVAVVSFVRTSHQSLRMRRRHSLSHRMRDY